MGAEGETSSELPPHSTVYVYITADHTGESTQPARMGQVRSVDADVPGMNYGGSECSGQYGSIHGPLGLGLLTAQ